MARLVPERLHVNGGEAKFVRRQEIHRAGELVIGE